MIDLKALAENEKSLHGQTASVETYIETIQASALIAIAERIEALNETLKGAELNEINGNLADVEAAVIELRNGLRR